MSPALDQRQQRIPSKGGMRILVATGSSGGHVFPALSLLTELKAKYNNPQVLLILPWNCVLRHKDKFPCKVKYVPVSPLKFKLDFKNLLAVFNFLKGAWQILFILLDFKPDVVVGFGSLSSIPVIIFAWLMRINTLIHEQNVIPGRANRLLAVFADRIAVSFIETYANFARWRRKIVYTGNPIRPELVRMDKLEALDFFGFSSDRFTILVTGGSQGSHRINLEFSKATTRISRNFKFQVIHLCGENDYDFLNQGYRDSDVKVRLFTFLEPMHYAYSAADMILCRAGALTVCEIIFFALPAIIVPYPYAYAHQSANAKVLAEKGCAVIMKDEELNADTLCARIEYFINRPDKIKDMRLAYRNFLIPDAKAELTNAVSALAS
jgi:UDP-N-acetylglucosamine--N-acetylmuramyl-(pentapeptide) pyrophosphoryl-undecaprenol N-acetylglucosamine transferase